MLDSKIARSGSVRPPLLELPGDLQLRIFNLLSPRDQLKLSFVCRALFSNKNLREGFNVARGVLKKVSIWGQDPKFDNKVLIKRFFFREGCVTKDQLIDFLSFGCAMYSINKREKESEAGITSSRHGDIIKNIHNICTTLVGIRSAKNYLGIKAKWKRLAFYEFLAEESLKSILKGSEIAEVLGKFHEARQRISPYVNDPKRFPQWLGESRFEKAKLLFILLADPSYNPVMLVDDYCKEDDSFLEEKTPGKELWSRGISWWDFLGHLNIIKALILKLVTPSQLRRIEKKASLEKIFSEVGVGLMLLGKLKIFEGGAVEAELIVGGQVFDFVNNQHEALNCLSAEFKNDIDIVKVAYLGHKESLRHAGKDAVLALVGENGWALQYASEEFKNNIDIVRAAYRKQPDSLCHAGKDAVLALVKEDTFALGYAHASLRDDDDVVLAAVNQYGWPLEVASERLRNNIDIVRAAYRKQPDSLCHAGKDAVLALVGENGWALQYASEEFKNDIDIVKAAFSNNQQSLQYASWDVVLELAVCDKSVFEYVSIHWVDDVVKMSKLAARMELEEVCNVIDEEAEAEDESEFDAASAASTEFEPAESEPWRLFSLSGKKRTLGQMLDKPNGARYPLGP